MSFESLTQRLQGVFSNIRSKGKLGEKDVKESMREIKLALLEADVNFGVVKELIAKISQRAVGVNVLESLTPAQQVIKIVNEELTEFLGKENSNLLVSKVPPTVIMMVGLQGTGKTTTAVKIASLLKRQGRRPIICACDIYRPAAVEQLVTVARKADLPVFSLEGANDVSEIAYGAFEHARKHSNDVLVVDTAGRLHVDIDLMEELVKINEKISPTETLLVIDAMTGQDAAEIAKTFNEKLPITGIILSKMDGDARGGAVLSVRAVTEIPVKFIGTSEKIEGLEIFHPDRMASRILGMGDVLTLIEKAEQALDEKKAEELEKKFMANRFTYQDFLSQLEQVRNMGSIMDIVSMIPGLNTKALANVDLDDRKLLRVEAIIKSMTVGERTNQHKLDASRRKRIANGSGVTVADVNALIKQFEQMQKMFKQFANISGDLSLGKLKKSLFKGGLPF